MRKAIFIGVIVCVLAIAGIGAAYAANVTFTGVGHLGLGWTYLSDVEVDYLGYELDTGDNLPVEVDGVYISFAEDLHSSPNSTVIFVSLRDASFQELAYCVAVVDPSTTLYASTIYKLPIAGSSATADPHDVYYVKVTVAENSSYSTPPNHDQDYGRGGTVVDMPPTVY